MQSKNELKEIHLKSRRCYYFDDNNPGNILLEKKSYKTYKNILIYNISYKSFMGSTPTRIRFEKLDVFIKTYFEIRYLVILDHSQFHKICDKIKYLMSEKSGIKDNINCNLARIRIDSYNSLPIEKILTFHNVIILFKSVIN